MTSSSCASGHEQTTFRSSRHQGGDVLQVAKSGLRILMGRTNDPAVPATALRRDLYVPVIGFVDNHTYLTWTRGGSNLVFSGGALGKAVRVEILPAGH